MTNALLSFGASVLLAGLPTVLGTLWLSAAEQTPARRAADILGVRWNNPPKADNPLAAHHTYHSAAMNVELGYTLYLPPSYATNSERYPVVYFLPGGGVDENFDAPPLLPSVDAAIRTGKLPPMILVLRKDARQHGEAEDLARVRDCRRRRPRFRPAGYL